MKFDATRIALLTSGMLVGAAPLATDVPHAPATETTLEVAPGKAPLKQR